jgi:uncharacterized membrane protein YbhN (UPF0104 family)
MPQTIVAEIRPGRRVVGLVTPGAIGGIGTVRYRVAGVAAVTGVPVVVVIVVISVVVAAVLIPVAITQRATGH